MLTAIHAGRSPATPLLALDRQSLRLPGAKRCPPPSDRAAAYPTPRADDAIRPAHTPYEQEMASMLVRRMYAGRGYQTEAAAPAADDPNRLTLAAWHGDEVVATLTVGRDSPAGLLADALYSPELGRLRRPGRRVCEVSRLAVAPEFSSPDLLIALLQSAHRHGQQRFAASDVVIEVNPRHARYYQRVLGFQQLGGLRQCPRVDAPALLLHRALDDFSASIARLPGRGALADAA
ncbi:N-acetyltransferase [Candidatus Accumulibacter vicinus]|uniref:N-acetyltransferase domain-containing protein n=1 Tax=Candidatus Accumulibacter vicinus TaxID=2954382 RepID=A0A084XX03_9PROT|nr:N-acetyltransferase [Candidatus Accumulibacter vicinus]KFB66997.1 MAG: hypothetical protein CAPSK01_003938 [Candidatus Accumulibacter vicinus]